MIWRCRGTGILLRLGFVTARGLLFRGFSPSSPDRKDVFYSRCPIPLPGVLQLPESPQEFFFPEACSSPDLLRASYQLLGPYRSSSVVPVFLLAIPAASSPFRSDRVADPMAFPSPDFRFFLFSGLFFEGDCSSGAAEQMVFSVFDLRPSLPCCLLESPGFGANFQNCFSGRMTCSVARVTAPSVPRRMAILSVRNAVLGDPSTATVVLVGREVKLSLWNFCSPFACPWFACPSQREASSAFREDPPLSFIRHRFPQTLSPETLAPARKSGGPLF